MESRMKHLLFVLISLTVFAADAELTSSEELDGYLNQESQILDIDIELLAHAIQCAEMNIDLDTNFCQNPMRPSPRFRYDCLLPILNQAIAISEIDPDFFTAEQVTRIGMALFQMKLKKSTIVAD
jgi:hypothetical protein